MSTFRLSILAADRMFFDGACESVTIPAVDGQYGILAHHSNVISALEPGMLTYRLPDGSVQIAAVSAGLVKVENNEVLVLADSVERPEEIDENRARRAAERAQEEILQKRGIQEYYTAQVRLARALNRLRVKNSSSKNG